MTLQPDRSNYEPEFQGIADRHERRMAALNLAFREGHPAVKNNDYLRLLIEESTGRLADADRDVLAKHLLAALDAEDR